MKAIMGMKGMIEIWINIYLKNEMKNYNETTVSSEIVKSWMLIWCCDDDNANRVENWKITNTEMLK